MNDFFFETKKKKKTTRISTQIDVLLNDLFSHSDFQRTGERHKNIKTSTVGQMKKNKKEIFNEKPKEKS